MKELQTQLTTMAVKSANELKEPKTQSMDTSSNSAIQARSSSFKDTDDFFCYRCGQDGHIATRCSASENPTKALKT